MRTTSNWCEVHFYVPVADLCEKSHKYSGFLKGGEFVKIWAPLLHGIECLVKGECSCRALKNDYFDVTHPQGLSKATKILRTVLFRRTIQLERERASTCY